MIPLHLTDENKEELRALATLVMTGVNYREPEPLKLTIEERMGAQYNSLINQMAIQIYNSHPKFSSGGHVYLLPGIEPPKTLPPAKRWQTLPSWEAHQKRRLQGR
jgi:hypothetical protein